MKKFALYLALLLVTFACSPTPNVAIDAGVADHHAPHLGFAGGPTFIAYTNTAGTSFTPPGGVNVITACGCGAGGGGGGGMGGTGVAGGGGGGGGGAAYWSCFLVPVVANTAYTVQPGAGGSAGSAGAAGGGNGGTGGIGSDSFIYVTSTSKIQADWGGASGGGGWTGAGTGFGGAPWALGVATTSPAVLRSILVIDNSNPLTKWPQSGGEGVGQGSTGSIGQASLLVANWPGGAASSTSSWAGGAGGVLGSASGAGGGGGASALAIGANGGAGVASAVAGNPGSSGTANTCTGGGGGGGGGTGASTLGGAGGTGGSGFIVVFF